jgi:hypothetical protein
VDLSVAETFLLALLIASLFLNLCLLLSRLTARILLISQDLPPQIVRLKGVKLAEVFELILQAELWEVILPGFAYSFIYPYIPLAGIKAGLFCGLAVFILGVFPQVLSLGETLRLPLPFWLHSLVWRLIKIILIFGTFGYFFN